MSVARWSDPNLRVLLGLPTPVRWIAAGWAVAVVSVTVLLAVSSRSSASSQVLGNVSILLALVFCVVACVRAARRRTPARLGWSLMALAMFLGAVGQTGYVVTAVTASTTAPSSLADTLAFLGYALPSLAAIVAFPKPVDRRITRSPSACCW
jgi:F0F1-type ATP synthase membrane subunit c/vacuolar-type H+-ATPase subunit K